MHPLLRVLDLPPAGGLEDSIHAAHPVRTAAPESSWILPATMSLGLTSLLAFGLSVGLFDPPSLQDDLPGAPAQARSVSILLAEPVDLRGTRSRVEGQDGPGPEAGAGHQAETPTLDPRLATPTALSTGDLDPDPPSLLPARDPSLASLNPDPPLQPGGRDLARGPGHDPTRDRASGPRPPEPDYQIVPIRQVKVYYRLHSGESADSSKPIRIRLLIGADGIPIEASMVSGPPFLQAAALTAARQWRFDPPGRHGLTAPVAVVLNFFPVFNS